MSGTGGQGARGTDGARADLASLLSAASEALFLIDADDSRTIDEFCARLASIAGASRRRIVRESVGDARARARAFGDGGCSLASVAEAFAAVDSCIHSSSATRCASVEEGADETVAASPSQASPDRAGRPAEDVPALIGCLAKALILADLAEAESLSDVERAAKALAKAGKRSRALWADGAEGIAADAGLLATHPVPTRLLEDLSTRLGALQSLAASHAAPVVPARPRTTLPEPDRDAIGPGADAMPLSADKELLRDFVSRTSEHLEAADEGLLALERDPSDTEALGAVFRAFHTIKGMAGFLAFTDIERLAHETESLLDGPRKGAGHLDPTGFDAVFRAVDTMKKLVANVLTPPRRPRGTTPPSSASPAVATSAAHNGSVRVDEDRLDRLLETVGELVIAESVFADAARSEPAMARFSPQLARLDKITRELQAMSTSLRMVPLHSAFVRMARVVRDTARRADKTIRFVTAGEETELDKLVVDRITDPLIHLLRNAVDHGIEPAEARAAAGKPDAGRVELRAFHAGGRIHIEVSDDGGGLDLAAIADAARRRGLLSAEEDLDEHHLVDLVFAPGLTTARTVTDVSGRGVGMDVVRKTVESLRGDIDVTTRPGAGTTIAIRLPLTLAIIDGMVVRVGSQRFILPMLSIERSLRPEPEQVSSVFGRGSLVNLDGRLVPLVSLSRLFGIDDAEEDASRSIVVVVSDNGETAGLVAGEILGQQQIVIKSLGDGAGDAKGVAGGAIMPDGKVGLILDVAGLVRLARSSKGGVAHGSARSDRADRREVSDVQAG